MPLEQAVLDWQVIGPRLGDDGARWTSSWSPPVARWSARMLARVRRRRPAAGRDRRRGLRDDPRAWAVTPAAPAGDAAAYEERMPAAAAG